VILQTALKRFLSEEKFEWLLVFCCVLIFTGFVFSRAMTSIGMIAIAVSSLLFNGVGVTLKQYFQRKELLALSLFFWIVFLSGISSEDKISWLNWVRIKLPYIVLPLAFAPVKKLDEKKLITIFYSFIAVIFVSVIAVLGNYFLHFKIITESFLRGNAIPMPYGHIRYTLMVVFALFACVYLIEKQKFLLNANEKGVQRFIVVLLFIALHILSVRSSLLALYLGIFFLLLRFVFVQKKFFAGAVLLLVLLGISYVSFKLIPSLKNKFAYMRYDMIQFEKGEFNNLSDGARLLSMKGGLELAQQNFWLGAGAGDLKSEMNKFYQEHYPQLLETDRKLPHNQLIWTFATTGIVGILLFLLAFSFPLFANSNYKNWLFAILHLIIFSSFFTEATLEEQIGTGFYLIFLLLLMNQFRNA